MGNLVVKVQKKGNEVLERTEYTYDTAGNLSAISEEKKEGGNRSILKNAVMTYDADNRLLTYNGETLRYDADGNMTYGPLNGVLTEFRYDSRNRLICAGETTYEYDAENNRIAVETETYRDEYLLDTESTYSQMLVAERTYKDGREETSLYVYGNGLIGEEKETGDRSEYVTYLYNHLGSTTAVTDENGTVVEEYAYGAYGELLTQNPGTRRFLYNGQYGVVTDENGLYHMRARYYNTDIKRFISRDIVSGDITNSQSLNRYCYVQGNPLSYIDPFGLSPESGWGNVGHTILSLLGFIPLYGAIADVINCLWYAFTGNIFTNSIVLGFSIIGAVFAGKGIAKSGKALKGLDDATPSVGTKTGGKKSGSKAIDNSIPNVESATINPKKLTEYALNPNHPVGGNKAKVFESALGYNQSNADDLMRQIYEKLPSSEAVLGKLDEYGQRYTVDIPITGPNGNTVNVRTGWIIKTGSDIPELTTIFVKE